MKDCSKVRWIHRWWLGGCDKQKIAEYQPSERPEQMDLRKMQVCEDVSPKFHASLLSTNALSRQPCAIRNLFKHEARPGILSLLAGKPK